MQLPHIMSFQISHHHYLIFSPCKRALRDGSFKLISATEIVPGDVVLLEPGTAYCDMVVLQGNCIMVDESALTGECTPVLKKALEDALGETPYNSTRHTTMTVSAGTEILETDEKECNIALVLTTGSFTVKGELLTDVCSYQRHKFLFDAEVHLVLAILLCEIMVLCIFMFLWLRDSWVFAWFYCKRLPANVCNCRRLHLTILISQIRCLSRFRLISSNAAHGLRRLGRDFRGTATPKEYYLFPSGEPFGGWKC
jgi:magnesium-transporting ATPase (P-type)